MALEYNRKMNEMEVAQVAKAASFHLPKSKNKYEYT